MRVPLSQWLYSEKVLLLGSVFRVPRCLVWVREPAYVRQRRSAGPGKSIRPARSAVEMAGGGKRGKPSAGFRSLPTALGNRKKARFPHSHRRDGDIVVSNFKLQEANPALPHPFEIPSLPTPPSTECPHCARPSLPTPNSEKANKQLAGLYVAAMQQSAALLAGGLKPSSISEECGWQLLPTLADTVKNAVAG